MFVIDPAIVVWLVCSAGGWELSSGTTAAAARFDVMKVMFWFVVMSRLLLLSALLFVILIHVCLIGTKASANSVMVALVLSS